MNLLTENKNRKEIYIVIWKDIPNNKIFRTTINYTTKKWLEFVYDFDGPYKEKCGKGETNFNVPIRRILYLFKVRMK